MLEEIPDASILVVDDEPDQRQLLAKVLLRAGCRAVEAIGEPLQVAEVFHAFKPDLVILDYRLPPYDGFDVLDWIWGNPAPEERCPVVMLTAGVEDKVRLRALERGVSDFLERPSDMLELLLRVHNVLRIHRLYRQVAKQNSELDHLVKERTSELEKARQEILECLALAAEYRDDETGEHARRVGRLATEIAGEMGFNLAYAEAIGAAALLHDLGKLGVADAILRKPGPLTDEELVSVREHPMIGARILGTCTQPELSLAREIALSHHERWDGNGYPLGLAGGEIPLSGRIVAVADAYDAMTSERPYKQPISAGIAVSELLRQRDKQFDPEVVDAFVRIAQRWIAVEARLSE